MKNIYFYVINVVTSNIIFIIIIVNTWILQLQRKFTVVIIAINYKSWHSFEKIVDNGLNRFWR